MANKLLILGNGFDIDLGLKTKYSDFAKSPYWDKLMKNVFEDIDQDLLAVLKKAQETETWFDIEQVMYDYVTSLSRRGYVVSKDKKEFEMLLEALMKYLVSVQEKHIYGDNSIACRVLKEMVENGSPKIYSSIIQVYTN